MKIFAIFYTFLYLYRIDAKVVTDEDHDSRERNSGKYILNSNKLHRRFLEDLDDDEWHVSHLKDVDFWGRKSSCEGETFDDKVRAYKRMLRNDGALVDFVSADPLPFNETDLIQDQTCKLINDAKNVSKIINQVEPLKDKLNNENNGTKNDEVFLKVDEQHENRSVTKQVDTATTMDSVPNLSQSNKAHSATAGEKSRRGSEYMFSSAEYYDEIDDFDETSCPAAVEVITLELDQLRNYEVECEAIVEWRSLE